ncbi:DNA polymerase-3 subunit delta' [Arachidicoccus rhizosphaerae]|uniref:DNA polymerase-3 subunit delta n=1 Tax=Arachidicoccus rhizosphaerae TaxID=551991 RepID=A0A1H4CJE3_9BACT|nr:DNA polymerase III subunit delta' [Arachidicoccus rhizosphaerae]SEA60545.1 DNA polymerase-3 subunit delta' [Arachidicoccus rhizosphaerae]
MQFKDIIGQQDTKKQLVEMVNRNRLSHALFFLGKEGTGALPLAMAFAQYILCENKTEGESCGNCPSCKKASGLVHPDIHFSFPVIPKKPGDKPISSDYLPEFREFIKGFPYGNVYDWLQSIQAENKQGNITTEECNDIFRKLSLKSYEGEYKILIQWMPEYLGNSGNKLLKLIEEPPEKTLFILVAENEEKVLGTILSRTQLVKVPMLDNQQVAAALEQKAGLSADEALQLAALSGGNYREAIQLSSHNGEDWQSYLRDWLNAVMQGNNIQLVKWIDEVAKLGRENQKQFLYYFNHLLGQSIRLRILGTENFPISEKDKDFALRINKIASVSQQEVIVEELDKAAYYIERNANAKMLFHALSIKLRYIIKQKSLILAG